MVICHKCKKETHGASVCFVCFSDPAAMKEKDYFCDECWNKKHKKCELMIPRWVVVNPPPEEDEKDEEKEY